MDNIAVSRRNHTNKKGNKENAQPACGSNFLIKRDKTSTTPFQLTNNKNEETLAENGPLKAKTDTRSTSAEALKKVKTVQKDGKGGAAATGVKPRQTHSQVFRAQQAVRHKQILAEAPKPPAPVPPSKSAPGMYKGKVVQSKIGSIWKSTTAVGGADPKPSAPKTDSQRVGNVRTGRSKSKSVADLHVAKKPVPIRSKSVVDRPAQASKPAVTSRPAGFNSARPAARTIPATLASTSARNTKVAPTKGSGTQNSKPKIPVTDKKVNKPPVSNACSQYRFTVETAEERRAKLADWLASKGKTFKRPAMTTAEPPKTKVSAKPKADLKPQSNVEPPPAAQCKPEPEPRLEAHKPDSAAASLCAGLITQSQTPMIMNTTLDLLENSDDCDLPVDPEDSVDDIVVNLCGALEAMATPSRCDDELTDDVFNDVEVEESKPEDESEEDELKKEMPEDVSEQPKVEEVKEGEEESDDQKVETSDEEVESDDEGVTKTTPQMEDASVIKYSVKTTPYLQSVKKTIEDEASSSTSRRKSNIKDLKFLTPVRRSCRIQRKSSRLPTMLVDHDPCVSSLAELVKLDDDANAYIYRKNQALLEDLPDQTSL